MSHRFTLSFSVCAAATLASLPMLFGCSDATKPSEIAEVRIVNVSPTTGAITANSEGRTVSSGVAFQTSTQAGGCGTVEEGHEAIDWVLANTTTDLGSTSFNWIAQHDYTVLFYGPNNAIVYPETFSNPAAGNMAIRFINATGTAGDIYLTTQAATISGAPTVANLAAGQASGFNSSSAPGGTFVEYPVANIRVRMFNVGQSSGTPRADFTIAGLAASRVGTVILTPPATGGTTTGFIVGPCATS